MVASKLHKHKAVHSALGVSVVVVVCIAWPDFLSDRATEAHPGLQPATARTEVAIASWNTSDDGAGLRLNAVELMDPIAECDLDAHPAASGATAKHFYRYGSLDIGNGLVMDDIMSQDLTVEEANEAISMMALESKHIAQKLFKTDLSIAESTIEPEAAYRRSKQGDLLLMYREGGTRNRHYFACPAYVSADLTELRDATTYLLYQKKFLDADKGKLLDQVTQDVDCGSFTIDLREDGMGHVARDSSGSVVGYTAFTIPGTLQDYTPPN